MNAAIITETTAPSSAPAAEPELRITKATSDAAIWRIIWLARELPGEPFTPSAELTERAHEENDRRRHALAFPRRAHHARRARNARAEWALHARLRRENGFYDGMDAGFNAAMLSIAPALHAEYKARIERMEGDVARIGDELNRVEGELDAGLNRAMDAARTMPRALPSNDDDVWPPSSRRRGKDKPS